MEPNYAHVSAIYTIPVKASLAPSRKTCLLVKGSAPIGILSSHPATGKTSSNDQTCPQKPTLAI